MNRVLHRVILTVRQNHLKPVKNTSIVLFCIMMEISLGIGIIMVVSLWGRTNLLNL